ncbi:WD40-repeat-containing domain protein [Hyaloraphidium curvatum]|nr:WD40-repeat-containing domain protein [Hyaloraphidium curvatum]
MPSSAGFASSSSMAGTRVGTAANIEGSTLSFTTAGGGRARSAGPRPKSKGLELMSNTEGVNVLRDSAQYRAEVEIEFQHLRKLLELFQKSAASKGDQGEVGLTLDEFKKAFRNVLGGNLTDEQMTLLFMKIDTDTNGTLDWDEFSAFILKRSEGQQSMEEEAQKRTFDHDPLNPRRPTATPHVDIIKRIVHFPENRRFATIGRDGTECLWNWDLGLIQSFVTDPRRQHRRGNHHTWVHDVATIPHLNMIVSVADDRTITLFDCNTMLPQLRVHLSEGMALCVAASLVALEDHQETAIYYGLDNGTLNILSFDHQKLFAKKPSSECLDMTLHELVKESAHLANTTSWKTHSDWTLGIDYIEEMNAVVSCSSNEHCSLVIARRKDGLNWTNEHASVAKGVQCFAYSRNPVAIITGGQDRTLRIWNPHRIQKAIAPMRGHSAPIIEVVAGIPGQCISLSWDKDIKVFDIRKQVCLQTIIDPRDYRPENLLGGMVFVPNARGDGGTLVVAGCTSLLRYDMRDKHYDEKDPKSHDFPICAALYNSTFDLCVSADSSSAINVWDVTTGQKAYRWADAHPKAPIKAMAFDSRGRRLMTGASDGTFKVWNHNNGMRLKEAKPPLDHEISCVLHIECDETRYFAAAAGTTVQLFVDEIGASKLAPAADFNAGTMDPRWHSSPISSLCFLFPATLCSGDADGSVCLVDIQTRQITQKLEAPKGSKGGIRTLAQFGARKEDGLHSPTAMLLSLTIGGELDLWDVSTGTRVYLDFGLSQGAGDSPILTALCTTNDLLLVGDSDGDVSVCMLGTSPVSCSRSAAWRAHNGAVNSLDYSDKHGLVVSVSNDTAKLWTLEGKLVGTFGERAPWDLDRRRLRPTDSLVEEEDAKAVERTPEKSGNERTEEGSVPTGSSDIAAAEVIGSLANIVPQIKPLDSKRLYQSMKVYDVANKFASSKIASLFAIPHVD